MQTGLTKTDYRPEIDGLRALAVIPVIFFHAGFDAFRGGFVGVDIFFVISGYLITTIILRERTIGQFSLLGFYERRARRILPALFLVLLCCAPTGFFLLTPPQFESFFISGVLGAATFSSNVLFALDAALYFDEADSALNPLFHVWSLAVEEQFYIFFPLIFLLLFKFSSRLFILTALIWVVPSAVGSFLYGDQTIQVFYITGFRAWELGAGVLTAIYLFKKDNDIRLSKNIDSGLSWIGLSLLAAPIFLIKSTEASKAFPYMLYLMPAVIGTILLIVFVTKETFIFRILSWRPLVGIGLISYSTYLWHQPLFAFSRNVYGAELPGLTLLILAVLSLVVGFASWKYVERPFRDKTKFSRASLFSLSAIGVMFFTATAFVAVKYQDSVIVKNPIVEAGQIDFDKDIADLPERFVECRDQSILEEHVTWSSGVCFESKSDKPLEIAVFGDSHALHLFKGLAEHTEKNVVTLWKPGWVWGAPFVEKNQIFFDYLLESESINTVIFSVWWRRLFELEGAKNFEQKLTRAVRALTVAGKNVVLTADVPTLNFPPGKCLFMNKALARPQCSMDASILSGQEEYLSVFHKLDEIENVEVILTRDFFCDEADCHALRQDSLLYADHHHLNSVGSELFVEFLAKRSEYF